MPARKKQPADAPTPPAKGRKKATADGADKPARKPRKAAGASVALPDPASSQKLVIVESSAKAKTINKYLGAGFKVLASVGHVRDLPKRKKAGQIVAGVGKDWKAVYEVIDDRRRGVLAELGREARHSGTIYLATDPDREGEAIAWHLQDELGLEDQRTFRITFNEITRQAVQNALSHAGKIDMDRVRAQEARRILDRVVGFPLSGLLNRKVKPRSSAGRVQSVALKLVVDREREIEAFKPQEYWKITALLAPHGKVPFTFTPFKVVPAKAASRERERPEGADQASRERERPEEKPKLPEGSFLAELAQWGGKKFEVGAEAASSEASARAVATLLDTADYRVTRVEQKDRAEKAPPPFITSSMQQQAYLRLHFNADRTMKRAQELYQGVPLGSEGQVALITYMRTDSTRIANEALTAVRGLIEKDYGASYLPEKPNVFASGKGAQEAHEAIRPTDLSYTPQRVAALGLHGDLLRLYTLIYNRFVASQMAPAVWAITNVEVTATPKPPAAAKEGEAQPTGLFKVQGKILKFDGFRRVLAPASKQEDATLPPLSEKQQLDRLDLTASQHSTKPPPRYNQASLIEVLKKEGIGRPSTYAEIIRKITDEERGYIEVKDNRFFATEIGKRVTDLLTEYFPKIMDLNFTSHMEEELDEIETGKSKYNEVLDEFWAPFNDALQKAEDMPSDRNKETGEKCPECGRPLVIKYRIKGPNKGSQFIGCSGYKEGCKYIKPREGEEARPRPVETEYKCPTCGKVMMKIFGQAGEFLRCSGAPECATKMNFDESGKPVISAQATQYTCDKCGKPMILREGRSGKFLGCSGYPKCRSTQEVDAEGRPVKPVDTGIRCDKCNSPMAIKKGPRGPFLGCTGYPKCRSTKPMTDELREKFKDQLPAPRPKKEMPKVDIQEVCPDCGAPMKIREGKRGYFLGCSKFPKCKGTREAPAELLEQLQEAGAM